VRCCADTAVSSTSAMFGIESEAVCVESRFQRSLTMRSESRRGELVSGRAFFAKQLRRRGVNKELITALTTRR